MQLSSTNRMMNSGDELVDSVAVSDEEVSDGELETPLKEAKTVKTVFDYCATSSDEDLDVPLVAKTKTTEVRSSDAQVTSSKNSSHSEVSKAVLPSPRLCSRQDRSQLGGSFPGATLRLANEPPRAPTISIPRFGQGLRRGNQSLPKCTSPSGVGGTFPGATPRLPNRPFPGEIPRLADEPLRVPPISTPRFGQDLEGGSRPRQSSNAPQSSNSSSNSS